MNDEEHFTVGRRRVLNAARRYLSAVREYADGLETTKVLEADPDGVDRVVLIGANGELGSRKP